MSGLEALDPYRVFNITRDFDIDDVKRKYKRLALKLHPDKNPSDPVAARLFQGITHCFRLLEQEYRMRKEERPFQELREEARQALQRQDEQRGAGPSPLGKMTMGNKFNVERFNQLYEEHRIDDVYDQGYDEWMKSVEPERTGQVAVEAVKKRELQVRNTGAAPLEMVAADTYMLGVTRVNDFSKPVTIAPAGRGGKGLEYTDYKIAHTTDRLISDPDAPFKTYDNVEQLEKERANISFSMSEEEARRTAKIERKERRREERRLQAMKDRDMRMQQQWARVNMLLTK